MDLARMLEERAQVWARMQEIIDRSTQAGEINTEDRQGYDAAEARFTELSNDIERLQRHAELDARFGHAEDPAVEGRGGPAESAEAREAAFEAFLRRGRAEMTPEQRALLVETRDQTEGTSTAGGYLVPPGYWRRISEVLKAFGGLLGVSNVLETETGQPIQWPNNDDTANVGSILAEATQVTELDLTIGTRTLGAYTYTSNLIRASNQLLEDSAFDLNNWIPQKLAIRWGRAIANHLVNGTGVSQPTGILSSVVTGVTGAVGETVTCIYDDLVNLSHSVDPAYRQLNRCRYLMADSSRAVVARIKDAYGRPLFQPSTIASEPDTILGYPVTIDQAMPAMAANAKSILFGDFTSGMVVRRVNTARMLRLVERYADYDETGFVGFVRLDARPDDLNAVKAFANSAT